MANTLNAAFNSLNNDELFDILRRPLSNAEPSNHNTSSATYEKNIAQNFNLSSEELNYDNDSYQYPLPIPCSNNFN